MLAERPDVMFIVGASEPTALVVKQVRELGFKGGAHADKAAASLKTDYSPNETANYNALKECEASWAWPASSFPSPC